MEDLDKLKEAVKLEHERCYSYLCNKLGKEKVDTISQLLDEALGVALQDQFEEFSECKGK